MSSLYKILGLSFFCLSFSFSLFSQKEFQILANNKRVDFQSLNEDGVFNQNSVNTILQDRLGYLWFGTPNGLFRYDGFDFKVYRSNSNNLNSISTNNINTLFEDSKDLLWIGNDDVLNVFDKRRDKFYSYSLKDTNRLDKQLKIRTISETKEGVILIGTNLGLFNINRLEDNPLNIKINQDTSSSLKYISAVFVKKSGEILLGKNKGIESKSPEYPLNSISEVEVLDKHLFKTVASLCMAEDENGNVWIGAKDGLYKYQHNGFSHTSSIKKIDLGTFKYSISSIAFGIENKLWMGTQENGLFQYDIVTKKLKSFTVESKNAVNSLKSNSILSLFKDNSNVLWVGTSRGGVSKLDLLSRSFVHYSKSSNRNSLPDNMINTFYEDGNEDVWIGTFNKGLIKLKASIDGKISFEEIEISKKNEELGIFSITKDNFGYLWLASKNNGLYKLKLDKNNNVEKVFHLSEETTNSILPSNKITKIYKDRKGDFWLGSFVENIGLIKFSPSSKFNEIPKIETYLDSISNDQGLSSGRVVSIFEDSSSNLWVGTKKGLNKIIRDSLNTPKKVFNYFNDKSNPNTLSNNNVFSIHQDSFSNLWIGTFGGGLNKIDKSEINNDNPSFKHYTQNEGLADNVVYGILEDLKNNLWISTNNGLSKYSLEKKSFKNYGISDGVQSRNFRKFAYHRGLSGLLYFGGINGFNVFDPDEIKDHTTLPKTVITDFKIFNESVKSLDTILGKVILKNTIDYTKDITLKFKHNAFSIDFASLHFSSPNLNRFKYKLENIDDKWIPIKNGRRYVSYSNLSPGNYSFKVKSCNQDGIWNKDYAELNIEVLPPIWRTWWMYIIYFALAIVIMYVFRHLIVIKERYQSELKLNKFEQEKIKELNKIKLQFFTNISHEFKTPLTLIIGPLERLIDSQDTSPKVKDSLILMQRNANQLFKLIQQVLEFRKVENNQMELSVSKFNIVLCIKEIISSFSVLGEKKGIKINFETEVDKIEDYFDIDKTEKIVNNLISNALKFTPENGEIHVSIKVSNSDQTYHSDDLKLVKDYVEVKVTDSGKGIPKSKIPYIFNRFYQVNETKSMNSIGSGVGLALTESLVKVHNGEIFVESETGKGASFIFRFPLNFDYNLSSIKPVDYFSEKDSVLDESKYGIQNVDKSDIDNQALTSLSTDDNEGNEVLEKAKILIVEDNLDMRTFISSLLSDRFEVYQAENGVKGLNLTKEILPDVIISDIMMPGMDGMEMCKAIKADETISHIPIILLTAKASVENRIAGIKIGADAYIPKPFNADLVFARIDNLLKNRKTLKAKFNLSDDDKSYRRELISDFDNKFLEKVESVIQENLMNTEFGVNDLGADLGYSRMQLYRKLKSITTLSANEFIRSYRLKKAAELLKYSQMNVSEILYQVGFSNRSYFTKCFKKQYDVTPREFRDRLED